MSEPVSETPLVVTLSIPCRAEYVGVARLAILGVASRLDFSYDEVEDLRLAVGEACAGAIDHLGDGGSDATSINLRCEIAPAELTVVVGYSTGSSGEGSKVEKADPENIGALLMEILVDSVDISHDPEGGTSIRLVKMVHPSS
ncbi:MAG TPA: ATP-binding protein [Armatimonadota bacterium]|jgi:serine/threonine-protein kinase RsbW